MAHRGPESDAERYDACARLLRLYFADYESPGLIMVAGQLVSGTWNELQELRFDYEIADGLVPRPGLTCAVLGDKMRKINELNDNATKLSAEIRRLERRIERYQRPAALAPTTQRQTQACVRTAGLRWTRSSEQFRRCREFATRLSFVLSP